MDLEILQEILPTIIDSSKKYESLRVQEQEVRELDPITEEMRTRIEHLNINNFTHVADSRDVINALKTESKNKYYDELSDKTSSANIRVSMLEERKKLMVGELDALTYPKHIKFGDDNSSLDMLIDITP